MPESTRGGRTTAIARWLVTSRHGRWSRNRFNEATWAPVGSHHARQAGLRQTACGEPANEWKLFWEIPFDPSAFLSCEACSRAVALTAFRP